MEARGVSEAWLGACSVLLDSPGHETTHLLMRMTEPLPEDESIRAAVDELVSAARLQDVDEVRNTIFPAGMAADYPRPADLAEAYMEDYEVLRRFPGNNKGTYFGRICCYPTVSGDSVAQLAQTTKKLEAARNGDRFRARYQLNIYAGEKDCAGPRGFPCMAHLGFQLGGPLPPERLDCLAVYRNQDMLAKGYGNLLGLAELQRYLALATGFQPGELTVIAGHADLHASNKSSRTALGALIPT